MDPWGEFIQPNFNHRRPRDIRLVMDTDFGRRSWAANFAQSEQATCFISNRMQCGRQVVDSGRRCIRILAVKGESLGRKALMELTTIVTPDTILRWHR